MMSGILLVGAFLLLIFIGVPIAFVIAIIALLGIMTIPNIPEITVPMKMVNGLNSFVLLSVPLFILAANLMNHGQISQKLIDFSIAIVGRIRGGLAHANILVSMIFAGVSGSSQADTAGVGKILIPNMIKTGYNTETAVGVTAASSTIGVVIPPSIPMIVFAGLTNASVASLFLSGLLPGVLIGLGMMAVVYIFSLKNKQAFPKYERTSFKQFLKLTYETIPALLTPVFIIGGIVTGWYTPTEAAAFASIYALLIGLFFYKTIKIKDIPGILIETLKLSSLSLFALAAASALGELMGYYKIAMLAEQFFTMYISNSWLFMVVTIFFFLFVGTFMDAIPAMILFVPVLLPVAIKLGISPVSFGIVTVISLAIGLVTPPYGLCLLIASSIGELSIERSFKAVFPYLLAIMAVLLLVAFIPDVAMFIPKLVDPSSF
jgi:C4-dicarboxylate transporter DctM subunit